MAERLVSEADHQLIDRANRERGFPDWLAASDAIMRLTVSQEAGLPGVVPESDRLDFTHQAVEAVLAHPGELVIFYHELEHEDEGGKTLELDSVIPDRQRPFELKQYDIFEASQEPSERAMRRIALRAQQKGIGPTRNLTMHAEREIGVINDSSRPHKVFMGPGIHSSTSFDDFFEHSAERTQQLVVGTGAVEESFNWLAHQPGINRQRLAGGLLEVAKLASDFEAPLPRVSELSVEGDKMHHYYAALASLAKARADRYKSMNATDQMEHKLKKMDLTDVYVPYLPDSRVEPYEYEVGTTPAPVDRFDSQIARQETNYRYYSEWHRLVLFTMLNF